IARARSNDDPNELADGLAAADRALRLDPRLTAAAFNRALALQLLHLDAAAVRQYRSMRDSEPSDSGWSAEAGRRMASFQHDRRDHQWSGTQRRLVLAASQNDTGVIDEIVGAFRQEARTWSETQVLNDWAVATLAGNRAAAARALTTARHVGDALV